MTWSGNNHPLMGGSTGFAGEGGKRHYYTVSGTTHPSPPGPSARSTLPQGEGC